MCWRRSEKILLDDYFCQDEYVGVNVDKFESSLQKLNGRYEEAVLSYNRPVYIQFEKPQKRNDNCIWWHSKGRRFLKKQTQNMF